MNSIARKANKQANTTEVRYLVSSMEYNHGWKKYELRLLEASSANLASGTGIGCNILLDKNEVAKIRKFHELPKGHNLFGVPVICTVTTPRPGEGGNVMGFSRYLRTDY